MSLHNLVKKSSGSTAGKITVITVLLGIFVFLLVFLLNVGDQNTQVSAQDSATTSVTVLNTPPKWTVNAQEEYEYSNTNPINAGSEVSWVATATDPNGENYWLVICKTSGTTTISTSGGVAQTPECDGGATNTWAISATTTSAQVARAAYTTATDEDESNDWYAWVCDDNGGNPRCNATYTDGSHTADNASPFEVNHRPIFTVINNDSSKLPGEVLTWTATAYDPNTANGARNDTIKLFVCRENDFTGTDCGIGGTYATSTFAATDPTAGYSIRIPTQDKSYNAYVFVIDNYEFNALGGAHGSNSALVVSNAAPVVTAASVEILNPDELPGSLVLDTSDGQTSGFLLKFELVDDNSCVNSLAQDELKTAAVNLYRSGVGMASCQIAGDYDPNDCYPFAVGQSIWNVTVTQDPGSCENADDRTVTWTAVFPLWHIADATDLDSFFAAETWMASIQASDEAATSTLTEGSTGNDVSQLLAFELNTSSISFGALEPGDKNDELSAYTTMSAIGNVGLNQKLAGEDMCPDFDPEIANNNCSGLDTDTIFVNNQQYATSSLPYGDGVALSNVLVDFPIGILKSVSTTTASAKNTHWGIAIPIDITLAGNYEGQNLFLGMTSSSTTWY